MNALRAVRPAFDTCRVVAVSFIPQGRFEALGPPQRWRFGKIGVDTIPIWATRVHMNIADFARLISTVKPDG